MGLPRGVRLKTVGQVALAACVLFAAARTEAFGLRTHMYIADQVYAAIRADCNIRIVRWDARVPVDVCGAILRNRGAFLAGSLGPDVFPDLVVGQTFVHPGTPDGRQAADWLDHVLSQAKTEREIAFAYGQLVHAAGDMFAHSYVNNYAGGVFELTKRRHKDVEHRHFLLEKYIDQRLPYDPPLDALEVPSDLLVRSMVQTSYLPQNVNLTHEQVLRLLASPGAEAGRIMAEKLARAAPAAHMTTMWAMILVAERAKATAACNDIAAVRSMTQAFRRYADAERWARWGAAEGTPAGAPAAAAGTCTGADLQAAEAEFDAAVAAARAIPWHDAAANSRETWWRSLPSTVRSDLASRYRAYEAAAEARTTTRAIRVLAPLWAEDVRAAVRAYMEASLAAGKVMLRNSEPVPPAAHEKRSMLFPYQSWRACYAPVLRGQPASAARLTCERIGELRADIGLSRATLYAALGEAPRNVLLQYLQLRNWWNAAVTDVLIAAAKLATPAAGGLAGAIYKPERISRDELDAAFRRGRSGQLSFRCVSDWIDADLGLVRPSVSGTRPDLPCGPRTETAQYFEPRAFAPVTHATTLAKLALLDRDGVRNLAQAIANRGAEVVMEPHARRYSVILDSVRSLDGSQQWQGYSLPPAAARGLKPGYAPESAGYPSPESPGVPVLVDGVAREREGFPYYRTEGLRRDVFSALFDAPFEGEILKRREYDPDYYPFRPCSSDPFRSTRGGQGPQRICRTGDHASGR